MILTIFALNYQLKLLSKKQSEQLCFNFYNDFCVCVANRWGNETVSWFDGYCVFTTLYLLSEIL